MKSDPVVWLLALTGLVCLFHLLQHGPRSTSEAVQSGFRWAGLLGIALVLAALGVASLAVLLCALLAGAVLLVALLVLVLLTCICMLPVFLLGSVLVVGSMELLP